jgi:hypothetical protein
LELCVCVSEKPVKRWVNFYLRVTSLDHCTELCPSSGV